MMSRLIWIYSVCPLFFDFTIKIQFVLKVFRKFADVFGALRVNGRSNPITDGKLKSLETLIVLNKATPFLRIGRMKVIVSEVFKYYTSWHHPTYKI